MLELMLQYWRTMDEPRYLAALTTTIGMGAITAGLYSLICPFSCTWVYGISTDHWKTPRATQRIQEAEFAAFESVMHNLSVRNIVTGCAIVLGTGYWQILETQSKPLAEVARTYTGNLILVGCAMPMADTYMAWQSGHKPGNGKTARVAVIIHIARLFVWVAAAYWCLFRRRTSPEPFGYM